MTPNLDMAKHNKEAAATARVRAALVCRLAYHIPRGKYFRQLATGLLLGNISYAAAATTPIRLSNDDVEAGPCKEVQKAINDVARTIIRVKRMDHISVANLLVRAGLPSYNRLAVRAIAAEAWKAYHSQDGPSGSRNPLGSILFGPHHNQATDKRTRANNDGRITPPLKVAAPCMVYNAYKIWNAFPELRSAKTLSSAKTIAVAIARNVPL